MAFKQTIQLTGLSYELLVRYAPSHACISGGNVSPASRPNMSKSEFGSKLENMPEVSNVPIKM